MAYIDRIDKDVVGIVFTDELHTNVGAGANNLNHDYFMGSTELEIRTASGGGGTKLTEGSPGDSVTVDCRGYVDESGDLIELEKGDNIQVPIISRVSGAMGQTKCEIVARVVDLNDFTVTLTCRVYEIIP